MLVVELSNSLDCEINIHMRNLIKLVEDLNTPDMLDRAVQMANRKISFSLVEAPGITATTVSKALEAAGRHTFMVYVDRLGAGLEGGEKDIDITPYHEPTTLILLIDEPFRDPHTEFAVIRAYDEASKSENVTLVLMLNNPGFMSDAPGIQARFGLPMNR